MTMTISIYCNWNDMYHNKFYILQLQYQKWIIWILNKWMNEWMNEFLNSFAASKKGEHLWKMIKVLDDCRRAGIVNWLIKWKYLLCWKVTGDDQRNIRRRRNFDQFVSFNCNPRSGHEMSGSKVHPHVLTAEKENCLFAATSLLQCTVRCRLFRKRYNWWENMNLWLWSRNKGVPMAEEKFKARQKCCSQFSLIKMVLCIISSLQRVKQ